MRSQYEKENLQKDIEICTFKPSINKPNRIKGISQGDKDFAQRNQNWMKYKDNKINQLKNEKEYSEQQI